MADRPIDLRRNSAGSMTVGLLAEGDIKEMFTVGEKRLLMIKEHATYEVKFADTIDPSLTNANIPNIQQRVFSVGTSSELLQRVLLTSGKLFDRSYLPKVNCESLAEHALDAMSELLAMDRIFERLRQDHNKLVADIETEKLRNGFIVPTLEDAYQDLKNFLQRADHFMRELTYITRLFEPGYGNWDKLRQLAGKENPRNDAYVEFLDRSVPYIQFIREARNAVEHPTAVKRVNVYNFDLDATGKIVLPSVEVLHPKFPQPRTSLLAFLEATVQSLASLYPSWIAHLCARRAEFGQFAVGVMMLPEASRRYPALAYSYATMFEDKWQPIG